MRSEGYSSGSVCLFVCLSVCLSVDDYSRTTGYEAAYERYQQLQCYKGMKNNVAILLKQLYGVKTSERANMQISRLTTNSSAYPEIVTQGEYRLPRVV